MNSGRDECRMLFGGECKKNNTVVKIESRF